MTVPPIKILMLDDSPDDIQLIERVLRKSKLNFNKLSADTQAQYHDAIINFRPDVVLSDHALPGFNSHDALAICRNELGDIPFILVSGAASEEFAARCLREGANDYIPKYNLSLLPAAIRQALKKRKLAQQKREQQLALRKENRELVNINRELGNFTYRVSHHLRGPITTAMGLLHLARQTPDRKGLESIHDMMHTSLDRLDKTLKCLLECSRNAHCEPQFELIDWTALINNAFARISYLDHSHHTTRMIHLRADAPVYSDFERIALVLSNVLNNSITYRNTTSRHEAIVSIDVEASPNDILIIVKDNGSGIRAEALPRVGEMFFRGTENGQGAGLGLYVAREILATLGGTLDITSTEGIGTTVRIELPNGQLPGNVFEAGNPAE